MTNLPQRRNSRNVLTSLIISALVSGCSSTAGVKPNPNDPWQGWNRGTHSFNDAVDRNVLKPLAKGYQAITPKPVDIGITNFFSNMNDIGVTVNDFLQLKLLQGGMDLSRFLVNSTIGVAGLVDVASKINLPKHNEDFGQTLGYWGAPPGNYLVLPFFGPSSPRETAGLIGDALLNPLTYIGFIGGAASAAVSGARVMDITDTRADVLSTEKVIDEASVDRYDFIKNSYRQRREYLVNDGNMPDEIDDEFDLNGNGAGNSNGGSANQGLPSLNNGTPPVTNNSTTMTPASPSGPAPVIDNSRHLLDLSPPQEK